MCDKTDPTSDIDSMFLSQIGVVVLAPFKCSRGFFCRPVLRDLEDACEDCHVCSGNTNLMPVNPHPSFYRLKAKASYDLHPYDADHCGPLGEGEDTHPSFALCHMFLGNYARYYVKGRLQHQAVDDPL